MKTTLINLMLNTLLVAIIAVPATAWADDEAHKRHENFTICEQSANKMFQSCRFEINEEYFATKAKCINLDDDEERDKCLDMAKETRHEDKAGCRAQRAARKDVCKLLGENRYAPEGLLDTDNFVKEPDNSNPYFYLLPGHTYVARAGEDFEETIVVTVTNEIREILGVNCRIVVDIVLVKEGDELVAVEVTDDYYAQALNGDVHYCGEVARNFEDGALRNLDGSFEAGLELAKSGVLIRAQPMAGDAHRQEYLLGEAEDVIRYVAGVNNLTSVGDGEGGENTGFPCQGNCVKTEEFIPPEPGAGEFKYFLKNYGFILGIALEDGKPTGERDEVLCIGDSLTILEDSSCNIANPSKLLNQLCKLSPKAFCDQD